MKRHAALQPDQNTIDETIIIIRHSSANTMYKLFSCKTTDKVIYEERLLTESRIWNTTDFTVFGYIACNNSDILKDRLYVKFANGYNRIVNDWIYINAVDFTNKLKRGVQKHGNGAILSIKKPEKKQQKRQQQHLAVMRDDSDSDS